MYGIMRPEARPLNIETLTRPQLDALELILAMLETAVDQVPPKESRKPNPSRLDRTRASRIVFLSGEPGSGKTTVYLAMRDATESCGEESSRKSCDERKEVPGEENLNEQELRERRREILDRLGKLHHRLVWLEPLNLETVADTTTNYLAAILARIDRVLADRLQKRPGDQARTADLFEKGGLNEALVKFQQLRADIGLAWDGNLPRRGEHLDPDAYAEEVMRAEGARIQVSDRLREVLEELTEELFRGPRPPLFVLPVDDLYLNPGPTWELLRLLRLISVPHLFIFAMGDEHVIEDLLYQRQLGELIQLAGERAARQPRQERVLTARARQISYETTRKLLPQAQRVTLEVSYWYQATELCPADCSVSGEPAHPVHCYTLGRFLELLPLDLDFGTNSRKSPWTMMEFLRTPGDPKVGETGRLRSDAKHEDIQDADAYAGMQILEAPPRSLFDLWFAIHRILNLSEYEPGQKWEKIFDKIVDDQDNSIVPSEYVLVRRQIINMVASQALQALNEQAYLRYDNLVEIENAITGSLYLQRRLNTEALEVRSETGLPFFLSLDKSATQLKETTGEGEQQVTREIAGSIEIRRHQRWRMRPTARESSENPLYHQDFLPPRPVAWFVLLHDLLVLIRGEGVEGVPLTAQNIEHEWAGIRWTLTPKSWDPDTSFFIPWPAPRWPSFWQFDCFLCAWNHFVKLATKEAKLIEVKGMDDATSKQLKGIGVDTPEALAAAPLRKITKHDIGGVRAGKLKKNATKLIAESRLAIHESLVYWWIRLAASVFQLNSKVFRLEDNAGQVFNGLDREDLLRGVDPYRGNKKDRWSALIEDLNIFFEEIQDRPICEQPESLADAERWLVHLGVIMAPEYGLPWGIARKFLKVLASPEGVWRRTGVDSYIREVRANLLERCLREDLAPETSWQNLIGWGEDNELIFCKDHPFNKFKVGKWRLDNWNPRREDVCRARKRQLAPKDGEMNRTQLPKDSCDRRRRERQ